jgi:dephospho-CoA kinase
MIVLGLTGGIGMGKTAAARAFRRAGLLVFDADAEVHRLQAPHGRAVPAIAAAFPGTVRDGVIDRDALRETVVHDQAALRRLERIIHPLVREAEHAFIAGARRVGAWAVVLDVPLLFETGGDRRVDYTVVVSAPRAVQAARLRRRRRMTHEQIAAIIAQQMPDAEKRRRSDFVIKTGLSLYQAQRALRLLLARLRALPPTRASRHDRRRR